jgi:hypothetical protein
VANVVLWMLLAAHWVAPARVRSETPAMVELSVRVDTAAAEGTECWSVASVRARIMHYAAGATRHADLRVELDVKANEVELRLLRGRQLLARRPLINLPNGCADRRDTVALATAMALEHAPEERAASPSSKTAASSASSSDRAPDGRARPPAFESQDATATSAEQTAAAKEPTPLAPTPTATQSSPETGLNSAPRPPAAPPPSAKERPAAQARSTEGSAPAPPLLHLHLGGRWLVNANPSLGAPS